MKAKPRTLGRIALAVAATAVVNVHAASHREAPLMAQDPTADLTDVYAFVSYDADNVARSAQDRRATLIMNVIPGQNPSDGPNYFNFADDVVYRLGVDNDRDGRAEDVVYEFRFSSENRGLATPLQYVALGPITALDGPGSEGLTRRQSYTVTEIRGGKRYPLFAGRKLFAVPSNVGPLTMPNYEGLAAQGIYSGGTCADGTAGVRVFAGQRAETFAIDLGAAFDTLNFRRNLPLLTVAEDADDTRNPFGVNRFSGANVNSIAIEVPASCLTSDHQPVANAQAANAQIGVYASTSRQKVRVLRTQGDAVETGPWVQVSRLANPLVNELIINTPSKDYWNTQAPAQEAQFENFYRTPILAVAMELRFGVPVPATPRTDLLSVLLKYPGQALAGTQCGKPCADLLRLNLGVPPTPADSQRRLGPFAHDAAGTATPDAAGWPNGRRPNDDVTDIAIRVVGGANYIAGQAGDGVNGVLDAPGAKTSDGIPITVNGIAKIFPFLPTPHDGRNSRSANCDEFGANPCN